MPGMKIKRNFVKKIVLETLEALKGDFLRVFDCNFYLIIVVILHGISASHKIFLQKTSF